jgi:hypothetical protein
MSLFRRSLPLLAFISLSLAEPIPEPLASSPREVALDALLSERDSEKSLQDVIATARKVGIGEQSILEARFLFHIDRREDDLIAKMLPEFIKQRSEFKLSDSAIFIVKEDWLAVNEYVEAIAALKQGDKDAFKSHITEAFWLSPRQASAFAPHIDRMRLEDAMRSVKIDFTTPHTPITGGDPITFLSLLEGKKALLIHFWSPASRECEASLPDYVTTAKALATEGIAMVSLLAEDSEKITTAAKAMLPTLGENPPGAWLLDSPQSPLARELRVQTLPTFILVSNQGKILFNGDPTDDGLWDALAKLDSNITRPQSAPESE